MLKKNTQLIKLCGLLLSLAPALVTTSCTFGFVGEPQLPKSFKKQ